MGQLCKVPLYSMEGREAFDQWSWQGTALLDMPGNGILS